MTAAAEALTLGLSGLGVLLSLWRVRVRKAPPDGNGLGHQR